MKLDQHLIHQMRHVFDALNAEHIKRDVDRHGLDKFINDCALLAGATGGIAGLGGAITMVVGIPASVVNTVVQQFRVTMAVIYVKRGKVTPTFEDFMKIVALSLGLEIGIGFGTALMGNIAAQLIVRLGLESVGIMVPVLGSVIGAAANYAFIKAIGATLQQIDMTSALGQSS